MTNRSKLFWIKIIHTVIYLVMAVACIYTLFCGLLQIKNIYLYWAITLILIEGIIFGSNGMKCPLTDLAKKYGAEKGYVFDTFLPESWTKYTFRFFGTIFLLGLLLVILK
ncbi:MAG: hypothetical protein KIH89_000750 [Candidatus Shapirobacteria bacterium]|nr:hypothetical protein [Candidatus Shapirobacteria bacterium]